MRLLFITATFGFLAAVTAGQGAPSCDMHHPAGVDARGDAVMGFDHEKTTHHFTLTAEGGVIAVSANDGKDMESRQAIRGHLAHIAKMFTAGDFEAPMLIHGRTPPGVPVMKDRKKTICYAYEDTPTGARIAISTADPRSLVAIHDFLRFQIEDHRTGDSTEVNRQAREAD
ncbi:MAG TPA: hypothetical protein VIA45_06910 [Thermoanaerobaculia bacterium]